MNEEWFINNRPMRLQGLCVIILIVLNGLIVFFHIFIFLLHYFIFGFVV